MLTVLSEYKWTHFCGCWHAVGGSVVSPIVVKQDALGSCFFDSSDEEGMNEIVRLSCNSMALVGMEVRVGEHKDKIDVGGEDEANELLWSGACHSFLFEYALEKNLLSSSCFFTIMAGS